MSDSSVGMVPANFAYRLSDGAEHTALSAKLHLMRKNIEC
jgi:hypothetical protein